MPRRKQTTGKNPPGTNRRTARLDLTGGIEIVPDDDEDAKTRDPLARLREDPYGRWPAGEEPIREVDVVAVLGDTSLMYSHRTTRVEIPAGVLPAPGELRDDEPSPTKDLLLRGRWNATWRGTRVSELSLDCFSESLNFVPRFVFQPDHQADLLSVYVASFPGLWGLEIFAEDFTALDRRDEVMGHMVSAKDVRLAMQIASRFPGVCPHMGWMEYEMARSTEITDAAAKEMFDELNVTASLEGEAAPGARLAAQPALIRAYAAMQAEEPDKPPTLFIEPICATLDTNTLIGAHGLSGLSDATLLRVPVDIASAVASNVTFSDAITAIRQADTDRLPLWLDFTDDDGTPFHLPRAGGPDQPLYGVLVEDYDEEGPEAQGRVIVPFGRAASCEDEPIPLCALGIGSDDDWRYPIPGNQIGLMTAHRGGVAVRHIRGYEWDLASVAPPITEVELNRELAGYVTRSTEWILARVGALLGAMDSGALTYEKVIGTERTFNLVRAPAQPKGARSAVSIDSWTLVRRLRELGSVGRVATAVDADIAAVREALDRIGVDPDQVRRDEVIFRFRRVGTVEAVMAAFPVHRGDIERFLTEAGIDWQQTPVPHDVTDPQVLDAISSYREYGTLEDAGTSIGVSGETIRRRLAAAGLKPEQILTDARRRTLDETVATWRAAGGSLAGAARELNLDPRTVKERLHEAGVATSTAPAAENEQEAQRLLELTGSVRMVAALMGAPLSTVRRWVTGPDEAVARPQGRPRVSQEALDQVEIAFAEHASVRAAARAIGMSPGGFSHRLKLARARHTTAAEEPQLSHEERSRNGKR